MNTEKVDKVIDTMCDRVCDMISGGVNDGSISEMVQALAVLVSARTEWEKTTDEYLFE